MNEEYGYYTSGIRVGVGGFDAAEHKGRLEAIKAWMESRKEGHPKYGGYFDLSVCGKRIVVKGIEMPETATFTTDIGYIKSIDYDEKTDTMTADVWFNKKCSDFLLQNKDVIIRFNYVYDSHTQEVKYCDTPILQCN